MKKVMMIMAVTMMCVFSFQNVSASASGDWWDDLKKIAKDVVDVITIEVDVKVKTGLYTALPNGGWTCNPSSGICQFDIKVSGNNSGGSSSPSIIIGDSEGTEKMLIGFTPDDSELFSMVQDNSFNVENAFGFTEELTSELGLPSDYTVQPGEYELTNEGDLYVVIINL